ncbi:MAG: 5-(carboxyamino)imidazole ribonucleotide synthase [Sphingomonadaceae bacterium]
MSLGGTIGILGGGQLGRMLAMSAADLGIRTHIYAPEERLPAADVAAVVTQAAYDDSAALARFAAAVDVVTCEFENVPAGTLALLEGLVPVRPGARAFAVAQDRVAEKRFVAGLGGRPAPFRAIDTRADLEAALSELGMPAILKTRRFGYDGKGQMRIRALHEADAAFEALGGQDLVLEAVVAFASEFSILVARGADGSEAHYPPVANVHRGGILAESRAPAVLPAAMVAEATDLVIRIADALAYVGVLACEFFAGAQGAVFNEMAPRVHNSGHWTIEGAETSQFQQHVRAILGLPLGSTAMRCCEASMHNLIGEEVNRATDWLRTPGAAVHLYGKQQPLPGRKMGHVTILRA